MTGSSDVEPSGSPQNNEDPGTPSQEPSGEHSPTGDTPSISESTDAKRGATSSGGLADQGSTWWYAVGGKSYGPVTEQQLGALARTGRFGRMDHVYAAHIGNWVRADSVHGLFDEVGVAGPDKEAAQVYVPGPSAPPPVNLAYTEYAGFWIRLVAVLIDWLVLRAASTCILALIGRTAIFGGAAPGSLVARIDNLTDADALAIVALIGIYVLVVTTISWLYFGLMESSRWQATVGKRAVGVMVTDMEGRRISFARATGRYFASWLSSMVMWVGYIMGAFTEKKQTLHDMIADTVAVYGKTEGRA